ncbi:MAG: hypothetical protein V3R80_02995 [Candidatus Tectomicrobia bacterium]
MEQLADPGSTAHPSFGNGSSPISTTCTVLLALLLPRSGGSRCRANAG